MDLVYLYGPPAVGKLTIATELARRTGFKVFHNHLSIDCVKPVFDFGTEPFWRQVHAIREGMLVEAARSGTDLIFTTVYAGESSEPRSSRRLEAVRRNGGTIHPVRLTCDRASMPSQPSRSSTTADSRPSDHRRRSGAVVDRSDGKTLARISATPMPLWRSAT